MGSAIPLERNDFDSGLLAPSVFRYRAPENLVPDIKQLLSICEEKRIDLLQIASSRPLSDGRLVGFAPLLDLIDEEGRFLERLRKFTRRENVESLSSELTEDLLDFAGNFGGATRFTRDQQIPKDVARKHKEELLRAYLRRGGISVSRVAGKITGYQCSYLNEEGSQATLYEIAIRPEYRTGLLAFSLLANNIQRLVPQDKAITLKTSIYADNKASMDFFVGAGMKAKTTTYWYHLWRDQAGAK